MNRQKPPTAARWRSAPGIRTGLAGEEFEPVRNLYDNDLNRPEEAVTFYGKRLIFMLKQ